VGAYSDLFETLRKETNIFYFYYDIFVLPWAVNRTLGAY